MSALRPEMTLEHFTKIQAGTLPELLGFELLELAEGRLVARMPVTRKHHAPNGYLHAASVIALADTLCGYATFAHLPASGKNFTTIELKTNFFGTVREGEIRAVATSRHRGRTTQVWDADVTDAASGKLLAAFRVTNLVLS